MSPLAFEAEVLRARGPTSRKAYLSARTFESCALAFAQLWARRCRQGCASVFVRCCGSTESADVLAMHAPVCEGRRTACCTAEGVQAPRCVCVGLGSTQAATPHAKTYATIGAGTDEIPLARRSGVKKSPIVLKFQRFGPGLIKSPWHGA